MPQLGDLEHRIINLNKITMEHENLNNPETAQLGIGAVSVSVLEQIRQAFADYRKAEGCSCCRDIDAHEEAEKRLAKLLKPMPYEDGSGFDWWQYCTAR